MRCHPYVPWIKIPDIGYLCPNKPAMALLDKEFVPTITIDEELFNKSEVIKDLGADNIKYVKIWEEILASDCNSISMH